MDLNNVVLCIRAHCKHKTSQVYVVGQSILVGWKMCNLRDFQQSKIQLMDRFTWMGSNMKLEHLAYFIIRFHRINDFFEYLLLIDCYFLENNIFVNFGYVEGLMQKQFPRL